MNMSNNISSKTTAIHLFKNGMFGNKVKTYWNLEALCKDPNPPRYLGIRYMGVTGANRCQYDIPLKDVKGTWNSWIKDGFEESRMFLNDSDNYDKSLLIQGEVSESERGIELRYSTIKKKMRDALAEKEEYTYGIKAKFLLKNFLDPTSYDTIFELLNKYQSHVIEFSCWDKSIGDIPSRNTIIWEVRNY